MSRIKVLQVSHGYDPPFLDVANFYSQLFDPEKYEVTSLFLKGKPLEGAENKVKGEKVIFLNTPTSKMRGLKLKLINEIRELIQNEKFDIVIAQRYKAIYLVGMASRKAPPFKFIGVIHAYNVFKNLTRRLLVKSLGSKLTLLGVSDSIRDDIKNYLKKVKKSQIYSLPNCIPVKELQETMYSKEEAREKLGIPQDAFIFGTAGRLHEEKDHETLIRAFSQFSKSAENAKLYIMGKGRLKDKLQSLIKSLGLSEKVILLGMIPNGPTYFKAFDVFVLPSRLEPFGMVIIEAMAAKIPVLSSNSGGAVQIIDQKELLFEIGDIEECKSKLQMAYNWKAAEVEKISERFSESLNESYSQEAFNQNFWNLPFNQHRILHLCHKANPTFKTIEEQIDKAILDKTGKPSLKVYLYSSDFSPGTKDDVCLNLKRSGLNPKAEVKAVENLCAEFGVKEVFTHRYKPALISGILKSNQTIKKAVNMFHGCHEFKKNSRKATAQKYLTENRFIAVSEAVKEDLIQNCPACNAANTSVIYNSLKNDFNEQLLSRQEAKNSLKLTAPVNIALIGRLTEKKGFFEIIKLMPSLKTHANLVILGDGPEMGKYQKYTKDHKLTDSVLLPGYLENAASYLKAFDLVIVPSRSEGFGLAALEAVIAEVPVLASKVEGLIEVLGPHGNFIKENEDLEKQIIEVLNTPGDLKLLKSYVLDKFSYQIINKKYQALFT